MQNLTLDLESLNVESFATEEPQLEEGVTPTVSQQSNCNTLPCCC